MKNMNKKRVDGEKEVKRRRRDEVMPTADEEAEKARLAEEEEAK